MTLSNTLKAVSGFSCQTFHQRTLSSTSTASAQIICWVAALLLLIFGVPTILIGAAASSAGNRLLCTIAAILDRPFRGVNRHLKII